MDRQEHRANDSCVEVWSLHHPRYGLIEIRAGFDPDFARIHDDWPGKERAGHHLSAESSLKERINARRTNPQTRVEILVEGVPQYRFDQLESGRYSVFSTKAPHKLEPMLSLGVDRSKPHVKIVASPFKEILHVDFREGSSVVEFDPPQGSRGEKRRQSMESSSFRRTAIPIVEGIGKGGWALLLLVLGPILSRFLDWLLQFVPDWELPDITLPHLDLPVPQLPQLTLPTPNIRFPDIPLPEIPEWVALLAEYSKIWVPVLIGIALGIIALRNHRKSEAEKEKWAEQESVEKLSDDTRPLTQ